MAKIGILILFIFQAWFSLAQEDDFQEQQNLDEIDSLYEADSKSERSRDRDLEKRVEKTNINPRKASDLKLLESFDDIAVIQRRYLPKSGRFEFFVGGGTNINDAFFVGNGLQARFGYHLNERFAIELMGDLFSNSNRNVTEELKEAGIETFGQVSTNMFYGLGLKWSPIYGKYALFNEKIVPFDLFFAIGVGLTAPSVGDSVEANDVLAEMGNLPTLHLSTGQIYALTKYMAFRWDLAWHTFRVEKSNGNQQVQEIQNNLFFHIGLSFFFPEAKYR